MENAHLSNFIASLQADIRRTLDDVDVEHQAFVKVACDWLGLTNLDPETQVVDGAGDRGVDIWHSIDTSFDIFQVKSHRLDSNGDMVLDPFGVEGVQDLHRAVMLLTDESRDMRGAPKQLERLIGEWEHTVTTCKLGEPREDPLQVNLSLVLFGTGLTQQARAEFSSLLTALADPVNYRGVPTQFHAQVIAVNDMVLSRWRFSNTEWRDHLGRSRDIVDLYPQETLRTSSYLHGRHHAVFFCRAIDLINAYAEFGYQVFEPNVRAHIERSRVNAAIRKSLAHDASRKEFQFLNNGVTITCTAFRKPTKNSPCFRVTQPGIVNGLQTVVALHDAYYKDLADEGKRHLEEHCHVLVRLLKQEAVRDIAQVVLASNTQNPMQARNLRSNNTEQIYYEKLFAQRLGWFYERKQGAWDAFEKEPSRWRTLPSFRPSHFRFAETPRRFKIRRVDNEEIAQTWLAFIGFSSQAVHEKRYLFEADRWYDLIFLHRTTRHGAFCGYDDREVREDWTNDAPAPDMMLVSYLARQFARHASLSTKEMERRAIERLGLTAADYTREELRARLVQDDEFLLEQVLSAMSFLFVEFLGCMLFKGFGSEVHNLGPRLLSKGSFAVLAQTADFARIAATVQAEENESSDILAIAWNAFRHTLNQLLAGPWRQSYLTARSRTRFNYQTSTRRRIFEQLDALDQFMTRAQLTQPWAAGIPGKAGLYEYLVSSLSTS